MTKLSTPSSSKFACKFCNKEFVREKTLVVHQCQAKRRFLQRNELGPRLGMQAYQQFYRSTQSNKERTYDDFEGCSYYTAFVKFGWHMHQIRAVNQAEFVVALLKDNIKLDWWTKDRYYEKFVIELMKKENPEAGVIRTIAELGRWSTAHEVDISDFFTAAGPGAIINLIINGRLSPWFLLNCDQGVNSLSTFSEEQLVIAFKWLDPDFWVAKFDKYAEEVKWIREILDESGFNKKL